MSFGVKRVANAFGVKRVANELRRKRATTRSMKHALYLELGPLVEGHRDSNPDRHHECSSISIRRPESDHGWRQNR